MSKVDKVIKIETNGTKRQVYTQTHIDAVNGLEEKLDRLSNKVSSVNGQTGDVAIEKDSELIEARTDKHFQTFNNMKARMDDTQSKIESKLSEMSLVPETYSNLAEIQSAYPNGKAGLFITVDTGHKYIWNNNSWEDAGIYQATGIQRELAEKIGFVETKDDTDLNLLISVQKLVNISYSTTNSPFADPKRIIFIDNQAMEDESNGVFITQTVWPIGDPSERFVRTSYMNGTWGEWKKPLFDSQLEQTEEFRQRGLNVKFWGAKGDGNTDDTQAIQSAIDAALDLTLNGYLTKQYDVIIPGGWYAVSGLVMSPLVHLKPIGTVIFYGNDDTQSVLTIKPGNSDLEKIYVSNFPSQQYMNAPLINGGNGSIYIKGKSVRGSFKGVGLELGGKVSYGDTNPLSRYNIDGLAVSNFDTLVKINTKDNYIGSFTNCHIEGGNIGVQFGDRENNVNVNSGENYGFYQCVIASCDDVAIDLNTMADLNFHGCSFDFNSTAINLNSGIANVNIIGGHLEHNYIVAKSFYKKTDWAYNQPKISISQAVLLNPSTEPIFKGIMYLSAKDLNISMQVEPKGSFGAIVDYDVNVMGSGNITWTNGYFSNLTRTSNRMYNSEFIYNDDGYSVKKDTETDLYEFKKGGLPGTADFPNGIHMVPTKGNIVLYGPTIKSEPGKAFQVGISKYLLDNSKGSIAFSIVTYDSEGKQIDETSNAVDIKSFANSEWNWIYSGQLILPTGTDTAHFKVYFSGPMEIYVNQTYFGEC